MTDRITKIIGPPGTGKTELLGRTFENDTNKYFPREIAAVSLTNAAISAIQDRLWTKCSIAKSELPYVRTIHSLAFYLLGLGKEQVADTPKHYKDFSESFPKFAISADDLSKASELSADRAEFGISENAKRFKKINIMRNNGVSQDAWQDDELAMFDAWQEYCEVMEVMDYPAMIRKCLTEELSPNIKVLYVDEMQDQPKIAFELCKLWAERCEKVIYIGDADQAIFRFAGANPESFIELEADQKQVLDQSYRVPANVHRQAQEVIRRVKGREEALYYPDKRRGAGRVLECREPDLSLPGTHMILTRTQKKTVEWVDYLYRWNIPFGNPYRTEDKSWNPTLTKQWQIVADYLRIVQDINAGKLVSAKTLVKISDIATIGESLKRGVKTELKQKDYKDSEKLSHDDAVRLGFSPLFLQGRGDIEKFFKLSGKSTDLLVRLCKTNPGAITEPPRVCVGTIHSVKGGEADHVWIDRSLPINIEIEARNNREIENDELRIAYVGMTRAKETLGLMGKTNLIYG